MVRPPHWGGCAGGLSGPRCSVWRTDSMQIVRIVGMVVECSGPCGGMRRAYVFFPQLVEKTATLHVKKNIKNVQHFSFLRDKKKFGCIFLTFCPLKRMISPNCSSTRSSKGPPPNMIALLKCHIWITISAHRILFKFTPYISSLSHLTSPHRPQLTSHTPN